jgi:hypothetical protein
VSGTVEARDGRGLRGPITIALIYLVFGPPLGALLVIPVAAIAAAGLGSTTVGESLSAALANLPAVLKVSYYFAGALALATGIVIARIASRHGEVEAWKAAIVPFVVFAAFALPSMFLRIVLPGAAVLYGRGGLALLVLLIVSIVVSLICWLITLPLQRHMR